MHDPSYTLEVKQALTLKPKNFYVHAIPRNRSRSPIAVAQQKQAARKASSEGAAARSPPPASAAASRCSNCRRRSSFSDIALDPFICGGVEGGA